MSKREKCARQIRCSRDANLVQTQDARINRAPWHVSQKETKCEPYEISDCLL
jgi:hypothetical protein